MKRALILMMAAAAVFVIGCDMRPARNIATTPAGAPPGAKFLNARADPRDVYFGIMGARPQDRDAAERAIIGRWIPAPGWEGTVDAVTREDGGWAIRMYYDAAGVIGGGIWVLAIVPGDAPDVKRKDIVTYDGRIAAVQYGQGGALARVVIDGVTVLNSRKGN